MTMLRGAPLKKEMLVGAEQAPPSQQNKQEVIRMRDEKAGTYNGEPTYCTVNAYGDCPYCDQCGICHIEDPIEDCDDFAAFFEDWEDWLSAG